MEVVAHLVWFVAENIPMSSGLCASIGVSIERCTLERQGSDIILETKCSGFIDKGFCMNPRIDKYHVDFDDRIVLKSFHMFVKQLNSSKCRYVGWIVNCKALSAA